MNLSQAQLVDCGITPVFVETGTFIGDGIECALKAGFKSVMSIELNKILASESALRFASDSRVRVFNGSSTTILRTLLPTIKEDITFFLDAHYDGGRTSKDESMPQFPVVEELTEIFIHSKAIAKTILIDDFRLFDTGLIRRILDVIKSFGKFRVELIDGVIPYDVLVARL